MTSPLGKIPKMEMINSTLPRRFTGDRLPMIIDSYLKYLVNR